MLLVSAFLGVLLLGTLCEAEKVKKDNFKDQFCTDPRTMEQHAAYDEWPDSYSCTRHRCQPGGRSLAIYTVGCKRVEAPESAIECEEVVEDTNMQFPFCCTRLRCLVVVRGEVWTRVLGQPWETLPAAPWSHMYKMKKPPPGEKTFPIKNNQGPIYELQSENDNVHDKILRTSKKSSTSAPDIDEPVVRAIPSPDIVIALSTPNDEKVKTNDITRHKRVKTTTTNDKNEGDEEPDKERIEVEIEDVPANEKASWTEIPSSQWNVHDPAMDVENSHALVDAIGTRMRDIESVVQRMSEKVHSKPAQQYGSSEKRANSVTTNKHPVADENINAKDDLQPEKGNKVIPDTDHYNRFSVKNRGSKYLHPADGTSEQPVFVEDTNLNGYFSDASNSVLRRSNSPKEPPPAPTYVAPVDNRRRHTDSEEGEKKHKKHAHKKKRKGKGHKKRHNKDEKRKHFNRLASVELDKNLVSLEDSAASNI